MGLRDENKAERRDRIVKAAAALFRKRGYEAVKISAIAAAAKVSVGTIYNYYQNKGDLLVAIVALEVNEVLAAGAKIVQRPPRTARRAVDALMGTYVGHSLVYLSKEMWRQAMAISTQQPESPAGREYAALDAALTAQSRALMRKLQDLGELPAQADAARLGEIVFNNTNMMFILFIKNGAMAEAELRRALRRQNAALLACAAGAGGRA